MYKWFLLVAITANVVFLVSSESCRKCKKNEVESDCINGGCDARNCSQLGKPVPCVKIAPCDCIKGCICKEGYLRADNGTCVKKENCPPTCKKHEVFSDCTNGGCDARNCSQIGFPVPCIKLDPKACIKGCICEQGYLRAKNGTCIRAKECPSCGGDPNATSGCGVFCKQCKGDVPCPKICKRNACDCKPGYVYDSNTEKCVKPSECTPTCKINEVFSNCTNSGCDAKNCTQLGKPVPCIRIDPKFCKKGCVCDEGFLRANNGTCIPRDSCPSCNDDPNAKSGCGVFCKRCKGPVPCPKICKINGCDCKEGYVYDDNTKKCTLPENCTPTCQVNEVYTECMNSGCKATNCSQLGTPISCSGPEPCKKGCVCKDNYVRADNGTCIPIRECPSCGGDPNAETGCGVFCNRCSNYNSEKPIACPDICQLNGCQCKDGYIYDDVTKKCVLPKDCTPICKKNEVLTGCINGRCGHTWCSDLGGPILCVDPPPGGCIKGCLCAEGYLRAENGTCVPIEECPCGGDPNAQSGCGIFCTRCSNYKQGPRPCPLRPCKIDSGCECRPGYIYDDVTNKCVRPENCTISCSKHEVYSECSNSYCDARNCSELGKPVPCVDITPESCIKGCVCEEGYVRDDKNNTCIPKTSCPPTCPPHEVHSDCANSYCDARTCSELGKPVACVDIAPGGCIKGCVCEDGYVRDDKNKTCIPKTSCPACNDDPNASPGCSRFCTRCDNYEQGPVPCQPICLPNGCECKDGYIYDQNTQKCVRPKDCTPTCKDNEEYSECINGGCLAKNCSQLGKPIPCIKMDPSNCIKGCLCSPGYLRADNGTCIPTSECPSCNDDPNAEQGCGSFCERCSNYNTTYKCPPSCILNGCKCKKGFIYDQNIKKCVLPKQCTPTCKVNEVFSNCTNGGCVARNCSQLGKPVPCIKLDEKSCIKGCVCASGYLRADNGTCVPTSECPSCNDDPNAELGCGTFCERCSNYKQKPLVCPLGCILNGCQCKKGFIYDQNTKKCVLPEQCTPVCHKSEEYSSCANGLCRYQNCSQYGYPPMYCKLFDPKNCKGGCVCPLKYLRNSKGICVPQEECSEKPICKTNEEYDVCPTNCPARTCGIDDSLVDCPKDQPVPGDPNCPEPKCRCKPQFFKDDQGDCVPWEKCPTCKDPNEVYDPCFSPCSAARCNFDPTLVRCIPPPKLGDPGCVAGCRCRDGYARNDDGVCIPENQCPKPKCKKNEVYEICPSYCPARTCGIDDSLSADCAPAPLPGDPKCPKPACRCKPNLFKDDKGNCVPWEQCPTCKGPNEEYDPCFSPCSAARCNFDPTLVKCIPPPKLGDPGCVAGCRCKDGYARNDKSICIPKDKCPKPKPKCKENEVYEICPSKCPPRLCGIDDNLIDCAPNLKPGDPNCPEPACRCKPQFYRDDKGNCVPWEQCPTCPKPNEEYHPCFSPCYSDRCDFDPRVVKCALPPAPGDPGCFAGCRCKEGFARNNEDICIPKKDCACRGDPNAQSGCGGFCARCSNYKKGQGTIKCANIACEFGACDCRKGYIYDEVIEKCVLPKDCTIQITTTTTTTDMPNCEGEEDPIVEPNRRLKG